MKKQIMIFVVGAAVFAAGYVIQSWTLAECQKPSSSEKGCANPTNEVTSCKGAGDASEQCEGKSRYTDPVQVPDGTMVSSSGTTSTIRIDCIKE